MSLQIQGIHHIVLTVSDPQRSVAFYERILGVQHDFATDSVVCIPCRIFLLCLQRPPHRALPGDRFDENRLGLDHIAFSVASHQELNDLLAALEELHVATAGIEFDPDGRSDYVCFRDPDNFQVEFYVGAYHD